MPSMEKQGAGVRRWPVRVAAINAAVPLLVLPAPEWLARAAWTAVLAALAAFVLLAAVTVLRGRARGASRNTGVR
jgi:hypothetical protein